MLDNKQRNIKLLFFFFFLSFTIGNWLLYIELFASILFFLCV